MSLVEVSMWGCGPLVRILPNSFARFDRRALQLREACVSELGAVAHPQLADTMKVCEPCIRHTRATIHAQDGNTAQVSEPSVCDIREAAHV